MKYIVIDLETTDLNPHHGDILEIGAVIDDSEHPEIPLTELRQFHCYVLPPRLARVGRPIIGSYIGNPVSLGMNAEILKKIGAFIKLKKSPNIIYETYLFPDGLDSNGVVSNFSSWLRVSGIDTVKGVVPGGKNFAGFDRPWLEAMSDWNIKFAHRTLDPMPWFVQRSDEKPPDLAMCLERAGIKEMVAHTALEDAMQTAALIREGFRRNTSYAGLTVGVKMGPDGETPNTW